jgi:hypothetical protein
MTDRTPLPTPATAIDMYLNDIALSLRIVADLVTASQEPEPAPPSDTAAAVTELREPEPPATAPARRKTVTRDDLQAQEAAAMLDVPLGDDEGDAAAHAIDPRDLELPPVNLQADDKPRRRAK